MSADIISPEELRGAVRSVLGDDPLFGGSVPDAPGRSLDRALWDTMAGLGWLGIAVPEALGGLGQGFAQSCALYEEAGRVLASTPHAEVMELAAAIAAHGTADHQARLLPALIAGQTTAALADPLGAGSLDCAGAAATGTAGWITFAAEADLIAVPCGTQLLLFAAGGPGQAVTPRPAFDLTRPAAEVLLDGAQAIEVLELGTGGAERLAMRLAVATAADAIGGAARILEITTEYLKLRRQFGRAIGSFQALKHRAAEWKVLLEAATALVRHAAEAIDVPGDMPGKQCRVLASSAKYYACDAYAAICEDAVQMHGGIGFTWEHPAHLYLKRAKLSQQMHGAGRWHGDLIARLVLDPATDAK